MSRGLYIKEKSSFNLAGLFFWAIFAVLTATCVWYGYRFYTKGETPPIPIPVSATMRVTADESDVSDAAKSQHKVLAMYPRYLSIESLGIKNSRVFSMGVAKSGELDTPPNIFDTGWYKESALPGDDSGALLVDGHNGGPTKDGVFKQLPSIKVGSDVVIERGDGQKFTYRVKDVNVVSLESLNNGAMSELSKSVDPSTQGLNIISCTGNWIPAQQTYGQRVIVKAALVK